MDGISRETFREIKDPNSKLDILFDYAIDAHKTAELAHEFAEKLDKRISKGHKVDMVVAGFMGFIGGLLGFLGTNYTNLVRR